MPIDSKRVRVGGPRPRPASAPKAAPVVSKPSAPDAPVRARSTPPRSDAFDTAAASSRRVENQARTIEGLEPSVRAGYAQLVSFDGSGAIARVLHQAIAHGPLSARSASEQAAFCTVLSAATPAALRALGTVASSGTSPLWLRGGLEAAAEMVEAPLNAALATTTSRASHLASALKVLTEAPRRTSPGAASVALLFLRSAPQQAFRLLRELAGPSGKAALPGGAVVHLAPGGTSALQLLTSAVKQVMRGAATPGEGLRAAYEQTLGVAFDTHSTESAERALPLLRVARTGTVVDVERGPIRYALVLEGVLHGRARFRDVRGALRSAPDAALAALATHIAVPR